jgi:hypothetical protein
MIVAKIDVIRENFAFYHCPYVDCTRPFGSPDRYDDKLVNPVSRRDTIHFDPSNQSDQYSLLAGVMEHRLN